MKKIVFIKLGGSLITDKDKPYTVRQNMIEQIIQEFAQTAKLNPDIQFILGNGAGSFGHYPVVKHNLKKGMNSLDQLFGIAEVQDGVARLNRIVVQELLKHQVPAISLTPSSFVTTADGTVQSISINSLIGYLSLGITPVVFGDIVFDSIKGCHILSTEDVFNVLIQELLKKKYPLEKVIHLTIVDGVFDKAGKVIPHISGHNFEEIKHNLYQTDGYDVTGGMIHKIQEGLALTQFGMTSVIVGGTHIKGAIKSVLEGKNIGTQIK